MQNPTLSQVELFAGSWPGRGWVWCQGQTLQIAQNPELFSLLGTDYGGDGRQTFDLPNLAPYDGVNFHLSTQGIYSSLRDQTQITGLITLFTNFAPRGWHICNGGVLQIAQYERLFAQIGNQYGGNKDQGTFALPTIPGPVPHLNYIISLGGDIFDGTLSEIALIAGVDSKRNWEPCNGQLLEVSSNSALYSVIGNEYGGDHEKGTFALPSMSPLNGIQPLICTSGTYPSKD